MLPGFLSLWNKLRFAPEALFGKTDHDIFCAVGASWEWEFGSGNTRLLAHPRKWSPWDCWGIIASIGIRNALKKKKRRTSTQPYLCQLETQPKT
jgi:hypothetical protein